MTTITLEYNERNKVAGRVIKTMINIVQSLGLAWRKLTDQEIAEIDADDDRYSEERLKTTRNGRKMLKTLRDVERGKGIVSFDSFDDYLKRTGGKA